MVDNQSACVRSASEGNLADIEDESCDDTIPVFHRKTQMEINLFSTFTTLPRRMGSKRKFKKLKKEDEFDKPPYQKHYNRENSADNCRKPHSNGGFFSKLLRHFTGIPNAQIKQSHSKNTLHQEPRKAKPSKARLISASNTDIRSQVVVTDTADNHDMFKDKVPAVCGIKNHGNTCFMNAVIQCLSNTDLFSEYFVLDQYKADLGQQNKVHARKFGTRGEVTDQLALLLKSIWSCQYTADTSNKFKVMVAKYGNQYEGSQQHDAQEFLLWLLDKVHEDLNVATKKKYKKPKSSHGRPDEYVAAEMLSNYRRCNNSFVQELFQAQFRSSLTCRACGKQSNTFDPYLCISLPIPHRQTRPVFVNVVHYNNGKRSQMKVGVLIEAQATVKELREKISKSFKILDEQLILTEINQEGFQRTFSSTDPVAAILDNEEICAIETPPVKPVNENEGEHLLLMWINQVSTGQEQHIFGPPFVIQIPREAKYEEIQKKMLQQMGSYLKNDIPVEKLGVLFKLEVIGGIPSNCLLPHDVDHPLYMPCVDQALMACQSDHLYGPRHIKLIVDWDHEIKNRVIQENVDEVKEDSSYVELKSLQQLNLKATLLECFDLYFIDEKLSVEDAWMCPNCRRRQQVMKKLSLWTAPDIFIVHLKRFRQSSSQRTKLTTFVEFPVTGLDVSPFLAQRNQEPQHVINNGLATISNWSPWRRHRAHHFERSDEQYDLYAVCNHHGSMQGGHYTAYCKNPIDSRWYLFDDTKVKPVLESEIVTADAYILFYQRSSLSSGSCASSQTSGYSTASTASWTTTEHWAYRMPPFHYLPSKGSQSQDNLCDLDTTANRTLKLESSPFDRSQRAYSSMVPIPTKKENSAEQDKCLDVETSNEAATVPKIQKPPPSAKSKVEAKVVSAEPPISSATVITPPKNVNQTLTSSVEMPVETTAQQEVESCHRIWTVTSV